MKKVKIGQIGLGDIAQIRYMPCYKRSDFNFILNAMCTRNEQKLKKYAREFNLDSTYTDYKEMLKNADIDAVVITTNTQSHFDITMECIKANKHVLLEKPMAITLKETNQMIKAAENRGIKFMPLPYDDQKSLEETRRILSEGSLGKIVSMEATATHDGAKNADWFYKKGSGILNDMAIYPISWFTGFAGPAIEVSAFSSILIPYREIATGQRVKVENEDSCSIMLKWQNGILATISSNWATNGIGKNFVNGIWRGNALMNARIYGTQGIIYCDYVPNRITLISENIKSNSYKIAEIEYLKGLREDFTQSKFSDNTWGGPEIITSFCDTILNDTKVPTNLDQARHVIEIIEKAYKSIRTCC